MRSNHLIAWTVSIAALLAASTSLQAQDRKPFWAGFLPSNDQVVVADEKGTLLLMSVPDLQVVREFVGMPDEDLERAALSPDGRWLAAHYGRDDLWVFDVGTGEVAHQLTHRDLRAGRITFAADQIVALARGRVFRWNLASGAFIGEVARFSGDFPTLSATGTRLATISSRNELRLYDFATMEELERIRLERLDELEEFRDGYDWSRKALAFTTDDQVLVELEFTEERELGARGFGQMMRTEGVARVLLMSATDASPIDVRGGAVVPGTTVRFVDEYRTLVVATNALGLRDNGSDFTMLWETVDPGRNRVVKAGTLSADGKWAVVLTRDGHIELWDAENIEERSRRVFGLSVDWRQPTPVTSVPMP